MSLSPDNPSAFTQAMSGYYDREWLKWTPEATEYVLKEGFDVELSEKDIDKVEAIKSLIREDRGVRSPLLFEKMVLIFNDEPISFDVWQGASPMEVVIGLYEIAKIMGEDKMKSSMSTAVKAYIGGVLVNDDIHVAPESLRLDPAQSKVRAASEVEKEVREQIRSYFKDVIDDPNGDLESHLREVASNIKQTENASATEGGKQVRQEFSFIRRQVGRLSALAIHLKNKGSLA